MTIHMIGYNGPAGAGKSWVTRKVLERYPLLDIRMSHTGSAAWESVKQRMSLTHVTYELFKELPWNGVSGRDLIIAELQAITGGTQQGYAAIHVNNLREHLRTCANNAVILCDTIGNIAEHRALSGQLAELPIDVALLTIVINKTHHNSPVEDNSMRRVIGLSDILTANKELAPAALLPVVDSQAALRLTCSYIDEVTSQSQQVGNADRK